MGSIYKDDLNLATRVVKGDTGAFDDFYARYADLVFAFIYHLLDGARTDAEDIWQDTFIVAFRTLTGYRGKSRLSSWLCGIARHKVADFYRRKGRTRGVVSPLSSEQLLEMMDGAPLPDEMLQQGITRALIVEALAGLSMEYRDVLLSRYVEEQSVEEISRRIGRSYKATESLLSRGRAKLRDLLRNIPEESL